MPRYPKTDYSHLQDKALPVILEGAIANPTFGAESWRYPLYVNTWLIDLFDGRDRLARSALIPRFYEMREEQREPVRWTEAFVADYVGNRIGWGVRLALLVEAPGDGGEPGWRMPDREIHFEIHENRLRRIRGLPPAEQIVMDRSLARRAALRDTLDRKAARAMSSQVASRLDEILKADPDSLIPEPWDHFIGACIRDDFPRIDEARELLGEAHMRMTRDVQKRWMTCLILEASLASGRGRNRRVKEDAEAAALAEDAPAFVDL